jgi:hypothetical protein
MTNREQTGRRLNAEEILMHERRLRDAGVLPTIRNRRRRGKALTISGKYPRDEGRPTMKQPMPSDLYNFPSFKFRHELRPQERPYDYYEVHPGHRPRLTRRRVRRLARRGG